MMLTTFLPMIAQRCAVAGSVADEALTDLQNRSALERAVKAMLAERALGMCRPAN